MDTNLYIFFFATLSKQQAKGVNWAFKVWTKFPSQLIIIGFWVFWKKKQKSF